MVTRRRTTFSDRGVTVAVVPQLGCERRIGSHQAKKREKTVLLREGMALWLAALSESGTLQVGGWSRLWRCRGGGGGCVRAGAVCDAQCARTVRGEAV